MGQPSSLPQLPSSATSGDAAAQAFRDLAATIAEIEARYIAPERGMHTPEERAAGRYLIANALQHACQCWFEADPKRPLFLPIAHRAPGVPNWIDAAGLPTGMVFWRFLLPEENVPPIETELVEISTLRR